MEVPLRRSRRLLAFLAALAVAVAVGAQAALLADQGLPATAATLAAIGTLYVAFLAVLALAPGGVARWVADRFGARLADDGHLVALVAVCSTFFLVFGIGSLLPMVFGLERGTATEGALVEVDVLVGLLLNLFVLVVPVLLWLRLVRNRTLGEVIRDMGLLSRNAPGAALVGVGVALASLLLLAAFALLSTLAGSPTPPNERALEIGRALSIPGALAVAALASVSEEVFFRGFLQPRLGVAAQAVLFAAAHLSYLHVLQVVATLVLGLAFGLAYRWTGSLWAPMAGHFAFNALMLLAARTLPQPL